MKAAAIPTVFIVDDDAGMRQAVQDLVESVGLRAESFSTGEEFLKKQRTADPSCLILDVRLPQIVDWISGASWPRSVCKFLSSFPESLAAFL